MAQTYDAGQFEQSALALAKRLACERAGLIDDHACAELANAPRVLIDWDRDGNGHRVGGGSDTRGDPIANTDCVHQPQRFRRCITGGAARYDCLARAFISRIRRRMPNEIQACHFDGAQEHCKDDGHNDGEFNCGCASSLFCSSFTVLCGHISFAS
jgi:hypothetical protein